MNIGEITGSFFGLSKEDIGMPFRPETNTKRNERKNISLIDELVGIHNTGEEQTASFKYYDPTLASFENTNFNNAPVAKRGFENSRLDFDVLCKKNPMLNVLDNRNFSQQPMEQENNPELDNMFENKLQNINSSDSDYLNRLSCNMFENISNNSYSNFSIFPIGILSTLIQNDPNIEQIMKKINTSEINHTFRSFPNEKIIMSRLSMIINLNSKSLTSTYGLYGDNDNIIVDFPLRNPEFAIGFIKNKTQYGSQLTPKIFNEYMMNLKRIKSNIYCPSFKIANKLNMNKTLASLSIIKKTNISYMQTICVESSNNIIIKNTSFNNIDNSIDLSENFIFYVRFVPNNLILILGKMIES